METCLFATDFSFESSYIHLSLSLVGFASERRECTDIADGVITGARRENIVVLVSVWRDGKTLVRWVALLEGGLAEACRAREVAEENVCDLLGSSDEGSR
jgi:hypothetical protein